MPSLLANARKQSLLTSFGLFVWLNVGLCKQGDARLNLAMHKPAAQKSTWNKPSSRASSAVDGIRTGEFYHCNSCSHTLTENNPWWMVDLGEEFLINEVVISNRDGEHAKRLRKFKIEISQHGSLNGSMVNPVICAERYSPQPAASTISYPCTGASLLGRYVQITLLYRSILTLCEVQVFGPYYDFRDSREDTFLLYQRNFSPPISPIFSTTTRSVPVCAALCLDTEFCTSFTMKDTGKNTVECMMYECQPAKGSITAVDTTYFLRTSVYYRLP